MTTAEVLQRMAPHCVLVGSAARGEEFRDVDLVVSDTGLELAREMFADLEVESVIIGHLKTWDLDPPVEVMLVWDGPVYEDLVRDLGNRAERVVCGVRLRAWTGPTEREDQ